MDKEEKTLLLEIDKIITTLEECLNGKWCGSYSHNALKLRDKVIELYNQFKPEYLSKEAVSALDYTCDKEVLFVDYHVKQANKRNAAKKRQSELINSINTANNIIKNNIYTLIKKIEEIKKINE